MNTRGLCVVTTSVSSEPPYERHFLYRNYGDYFRAAGFNVVYLPAAPGTRALLRRLRPELLVLSGGNDLGAVSSRDRAERDCLDAALSSKVPVLGICRGLQMIAAHFGGRIRKDAGVEGHVARRHRVRVVDPLWRRRLPAEGVTVNSFHRQGLLAEDLAGPLLPIALSEPDGLVEALYHPRRRLAAVQWHPERPGAPRLFDRVILSRLLGARW